MQIFSVHPLRNEAIVFMPDKNLRGMTALSVLFRQFDSSAERLCFAWESCGHMAMSISDFAIHHSGSSRRIAIYATLPPTVASHNFRKITRGFAASSVAILTEAWGGVTARKQCDGAVN
jgi:hypothetical protein